MDQVATSQLKEKRGEPEFVMAVLLREAPYWEQSHTTNLSKCLLPSHTFHPPHITIQSWILEALFEQGCAEVE